jgi:hypothetical protein
MKKEDEDKTKVKVNMHNNNLQKYLNQRHIFIIAVVVLILGIGIGYRIFYKFGPISRNCYIEYISQDELINLEKKRIEHEGGEQDNYQQNLFFGKNKEATELMAKLAGARQRRNTKVLL